MTTPLSPASHDRPTRVRHIVVGVCTLMAVLLYLDRFCIGFAADYIRDDLRLTESQMDWFKSVFFLSYALAQVPSGWLSDRFGSRPMLVIYILGWSIFTAFTGLVTGFVSAVAMRLLIGLFQAGAYPSSASLLSRWVPLSNRANASAIVSFGGRMGGALAPVMTALLILALVPRESPLPFTSNEILQPFAVSDRLVNAGKASGASPAGRVWELLSEQERTEVTAISNRGRETARRLLDEIVAAHSGSLGAEELKQIRNTLDKPDRLTRSQLVALLTASARRHEQLLSSNQREEIRTELARSANAEDVRTLAEALNSVMERDDFFREADFAATNPVGEVTAAIKRLNRGDQLSSRERLRFHRLLLETAFPREVKALYVRGWRPVMWIYGLSGIVVAGVFWLYFRDRPDEHPGCNAAEQALIRGGRDAPPPASAAPPKLPIGPALRSPGMWILNITQVGTNVGWLFIALYLPQYLYDVHHVSIVERGFMSMMPMVVGMIGLLLGGKFTDWLTVRVGLRWGRVLPLSVTRFIAAAGYGLVLCLTLLPADSPLSSPWVYTAAFCLVSFGVDSGLGAIWALYQDIGGKHVGALLGWGNMWGNLGAFFAPHLYRMVLGPSPKPADWNSMFVVCLLSFVASGLTLFAVDTTRPVVAAEKPPSPAP